MGINGREQACSDQDVIHVLNPIIAMIGPLLPELPDLICNLITSLDATKCKTALNFLDTQIVSQINRKLDGTQSEQDDLIFSTTVDSILYQGTETWLLTTYLWDELPTFVFQLLQFAGVLPPEAG